MKYVLGLLLVGVVCAVSGGLYGFTVGVNSAIPPEPEGYIQIPVKEVTITLPPPKVIEHTVTKYVTDVQYVDKLAEVEVPRHYEQLKNVDKLREVYQKIVLNPNYIIAPTTTDQAWCVDYTLFVQREFAKAGYIGINQQLVWTDSLVGGSLVRHDFVPHWGMTATTQDNLIWYFEADLEDMPKMHRIWSSR